MMVYIAGPYTARAGKSEDDHVADALVVATAVRDAGHVPYVPHLSHYWHARHPRPYEDWMAIDLAIVGRCDALLRMQGDSPGADREVAHAKALGLPVVYDVSEIAGLGAQRADALARRDREWRTAVMRVAHSERCDYAPALGRECGCADCAPLRTLLGPTASGQPAPTPEGAAPEGAEPAAPKGGAR